MKWTPMWQLEKMNPVNRLWKKMPQAGEVNQQISTFFFFAHSREIIAVCYLLDTIVGLPHPTVSDPWDRDTFVGYISTTYEVINIFGSLTKIGLSLKPTKHTKVNRSQFLQSVWRIWTNMIFFGSLLTTFEAAAFYEASGAVVKISSSLKPYHHKQV